MNVKVPENKQKTKMPLLLGKPETIYLVEADTGCGLRYKIGRTHQLRRRYDALVAACPVEIMLIHDFTADDGKQAERRLHAMYDTYRVRGEWFDLPREAVEAIQLIASFHGGRFWMEKIAGVEPRFFMGMPYTARQICEAEIIEVAWCSP